MKIIMCSQDIGSAQQNSALINFFFKKNIFAEILVFTNPKFSKVYNFNQHLKTDNRKTKINTISELHSKLEIKKLVKDFKPNYALIGISNSTKNNIDITILEIAKQIGIKTGCIQDYWGNIGFFETNFCPNEIFVFDKLAYSITQKKIENIEQNIKIFISGSPKHEYILKPVQPIEQIFEKTIDIVYFLQPLNLPGIKENFSIFLDMIRHFPTDLQFLVKPHPSEKSERTLKQVLERKGFDPLKVVNNSSNVNSLMSSAKIIITNFSTIGIDFCYLLANNRAPLGNLIYFTAGSNIRSLLLSELGQITVPGTEFGLGKQAFDKHQLHSLICACLENKNESLIFWNNAKKNLLSASKPSEFIMKLIYSNQNLV